MAAAILKLWEKSLVVKIAVKRGIQNTNNKLMAEELKVCALLLVYVWHEVFYNALMYVCITFLDVQINVRKL